MNAVKKVEVIATKAHEGQYRRDGVTPYIEHPKAVAARVKGDEKAEMVAWLHDVIEDTKKENKASLKKKVFRLM
jgi:(p)ppGpp synthase/HD superfamily hydrolase